MARLFFLIIIFSPFMKLKKVIPAGQIAEMLGRNLLGDENLLIDGINEIHKVTPGDITFSDNPKYYKRALNSDASLIILDSLPEGIEHNKTIIISPSPFDDYNRLVEKYKYFIPDTQAIAEDLIIGQGSVIQPNVYIGRNVIIGNNCIIHANVSIYKDTIIGDNVIIHANTVIGGDAFYYKRKQEGYTRLNSCGRVIIENDVEIGNNCTIDKGVSGDTIIGAGTKMDNLIHIGHGTVLGKNCLLAAQVGIAGKVKIGNNVSIWGQVGISKDLEIGDNAVILAKSGVPGSLEGNKQYFGIPVVEAREKMKELAYIKRIGELFEAIKKMTTL